MEKMLKIPLAMMVSVLSVFLVAGGANAAPCPSCAIGSGDCGCVADSVNCPSGNYYLTGVMNCSTPHGIIIGAPGVTIDGQDPTTGVSYSINAVGDRYCEVNCEDGPNPPNAWCCGHPCRMKDVDPHDNNCATNNGCLDSGILNADPSTCQGGFSDVVVRNLEITGWCDGIFMSGDGTEGSEVRLTGLLIEGNCIHDNGGGDCGTYDPTGDDGGDWTHRNYNDAIFLAEVGLTNDIWNYHERIIGGNEYPDLILDGSPLPSNRNIIRHNRIYNQTGCASISCPGGSGINLNGGLEIATVVWCGCNEIEKNVIKNCAMSGIQFHHATTYNRIHGNYLTGNGFYGIANACGWCSANYIYDNSCVANGGGGIVSRAMSKIMNNFCLDNMDTTLFSNEPDFGDAELGIGIMVEATCDPLAAAGMICEVDEASKILANTCVGNDYQDILDAGAADATGDQNMCKTANNYCDTNSFDPACTPTSVCQEGACRYVAGARLNCRADLDHDGIVTWPDFGILANTWLNSDCCPCE